MTYSLYVGNRYEPRILIGKFQTHTELLARFHSYEWTTENKLFCHYFEVMNETDQIVYGNSLTQFLSCKDLELIAVSLGMQKQYV